MARRFLAFILHDPDAARPRTLTIETKSALKRVYGDDRLVVLSDGDVVDLGGAGVLIGDLYSKQIPFRKISRLDDAEADAVSTSGGQWLIDACWGGYTAFLRPSDQSSVLALRDPSGAAPCFYKDDPSFTIVASDIALLTASDPPGVDWTSVAAMLQSNLTRTERTGLKGVRELLPGFMARFTPQTRQHAAWSPWDHARANLEIGDEDLADLLRSTIHATVKAWASNYDRISMGVSGGLDSSVVAASLAHSGCAPILFTMVTDDPGGDERLYASALAERLGLPLRECRYDLSRVDITRSAAAHLPRPLVGQAAQSVDGQRLSLHRDAGVKAHFTGTGGDSVFCYLRSGAPVADRFMAEGFSPGLMSSVLDMSRLTKASAGRVAGLALAHLVHKRQYRPTTPDNRFLKPEALPDWASTHPWMSAPADIPPGKARHATLVALSNAFNNADLTQSLPPVVAPLLSQTVTELCLAVPSWKWSVGGVNRSPIRRAFSDVLPRTVLERTSKGGPTPFTNQLFTANQPLLKEFLLSGHVEASGIMDAATVEAALMDERPLSHMDRRNILDLANVEAWARVWA